MRSRCLYPAVAVFAWLAAHGTAFATTDGICYRQANVPAGDVLNLRASPNARARVVLASNLGDVGVIAKAGPCRSGWCRVAVFTGDGSMRGWMHQRNLRRSECP